MKNLFFLLVCLCLFFACGKDEMSTTGASDTTTLTARVTEGSQEGDNAPVVRNGYLVFDCEEKMETFVHSMADNQIDPTTIGSTYGFSSYLTDVAENATNEGIMDDEYFAAILNQHGMVGVGSYVFKMNPVTEEVFAITSNASNNDIKSLGMAENQADLPENAMAFSFEDEVFHLLEEDGGVVCEAKWWGCGETCRTTKKRVRKNQEYCVDNNNSGGFYLHARYWTGGIWHYANVRLEHNCDPDVFGACDTRTLNDIRWTAKWKRKCTDCNVLR